MIDVLEDGEFLIHEDNEELKFVHAVEGQLCQPSSTSNVWYGNLTMVVLIRMLGVLL